MTHTKSTLTNASIIEAARAVIREEGIARLSMDRVAAKAELSKGAVMYHFPSKRALLSALIHDYTDHLDRQLRHYMQAHGDDEIESLIPAYLDWYQNFQADNKGWATVGVQLLSQQATDPDLLKPLLDWYARLFDRLQKLPKNRRTKLTLAIIAMEGFFYMTKFGMHDLNQNRQQEVFGLLRDLAGVKAPPAPKEN